MDAEKLKRLREQYADAQVFDVHTERFVAIAQSLTGDGADSAARPKPYSGISTLLDAPAQEGLQDLDAALIGVPMDLGVTNRPGARFGPRAVRDVERIGPYNHATHMLPLDHCRFADVGDVPFQSRYSLESSMADIERYFDTVVQAGVVPVSVGGDHSISYPILRALGRDEPLAMVHIDAHCDTAGIYEGSKFSHGGPFRGAVLDGVLDPERTIQIGIRGASEIIWEFSYTAGMTVLHIEDVMHMGVDGVLAEVQRVVGDAPYYLSIDVDGFDPAYAPGTGTPEVGGLTPREGLAIVRGLAGMDIRGADVVEVAPMYDPSTNTAQLGAQLLFEALCLVAERCKRAPS